MLTIEKLELIHENLKRANLNGLSVMFDSYEVGEYPNTYNLMLNGEQAGVIWETIADDFIYEMERLK